MTFKRVSPKIPMLHIKQLCVYPTCLVTSTYLYSLVFTSTTEVMFSSAFVHLKVSSITHKQLDRSPLNWNDAEWVREDAIAICCGYSNSFHCLYCCKISIMKLSPIPRERTHES